MDKHTAIYCRVSSSQQDTASQEPDLKRYESQDGSCQWYRDKFTGKSMDRKGWNRLMDDVRTGKVSRIVCWRLDRLGRTAKGLTALFSELLERKVNLVSIRDGIDLNTPAGRLMAHVLASVAQYETEVRAERVLAGQAVARSRGKRWGGSKPGRRVKVTDEQVTTIVRMSVEGAKIAAIARATGLTRPDRVRLFCPSRTNRGGATARDVIVEGSRNRFRRLRSARSGETLKAVKSMSRKWIRASIAPMQGAYVPIFYQRGISTAVCGVVLSSGRCHRRSFVLMPPPNLRPQPSGLGNHLISARRRQFDLFQQFHRGHYFRRDLPRFGHDWKPYRSRDDEDEKSFS